MILQHSPAPPAIAPPSLSGPSFEELRDLGRQAVDAGRFAEALRFFDDALEIARREEDRDLLDLALCNRSTVLIALGRQGEVTTELRQILMRGGSNRNSFLAAYHLSRAHEIAKTFKKGLFYGRIARDRALTLGHELWLASALNQIGNCLLGESYFKEAVVAYEDALALLPEEVSKRRAASLTNLGYCKMMTGELRQGMELSLRAFRDFRRLRAENYVMWSHIDLCYGYLELERLGHARRHGLVGLEMAERIGDPTPVKNVIFLLGEVERTAGEEQAAHAYFSQLQTRFYPGSPQLADLMLAVSMRQVVNLRA